MAGFFDRVKENWKSNIDYYKKVYGREKPLPSWTDSDVEEFIKSDPVYGPQMRLIKDGKRFIGVGGVLGAAHLAGISWKYSKSPHGTVLAGLFGGFCGMTFGKEVAGVQDIGISYTSINPEKLSRLLYWWEDKTAGKTVIRRYLPEAYCCRHHQLRIESFQFQMMTPPSTSQSNPALF